MRPNPGGEIAPEHVVGRDALIIRLWEILQRQSLILVAERRIGKTCIIKKMIAEKPDHILMVYSDVEGINSTREFASEIVGSLRHHRKWHAQAREWFRRLFQRVEGAQIGEHITLPKGLTGEWNETLTSIATQITTKHKGPVIFAWDELPAMLKNIAEHEGPDVAMQVLRILRSLRQSHANLRMVFTGSIGLHHVLNAMGQAGHYGPVTNDMHTDEVPALDAEAAAHLAGELLAGKKITPAPGEDPATCIAGQVDGHPFFIQHVCDDLPADRQVSAAEVTELVTQAIQSPESVWQLQHYETRIPHYYDETDAPVALAALDTVAHSDTPLTRDEIVNRLRSRSPDANESQIEQVITLLCQDHYLASTDASYDFKFSLVKRWWRQHRS